MQQITQRPVTASGQFTIGGDLTVYRLGFGAMRLTGPGIWGPPADKQEAIAVLHRALELGVNLIDTADSYGPEVSESLIAEVLYPGHPWLLENWLAQGALLTRLLSGTMLSPVKLHSPGSSNAQVTCYQSPALPR
jgi:Aldo/keto reductase family